MRLGEGIVAERRRDQDLAGPRIFTQHFYKDRDGRPAFPIDSFYDVIAGKIPPAKYATRSC